MGPGSAKSANGVQVYGFDAKYTSKYFKNIRYGKGLAQTKRPVWFPAFSMQYGNGYFKGLKTTSTTSAVGKNSFANFCMSAVVMASIIFSKLAGESLLMLC